MADNAQGSIFRDHVAKSRRSRRVVGFVGWLFVAIGVGVSGYFAGWPIYQWASAQGWEPVACTITHSDVDSQSSDDGTTYRIDIRFAYRFRGVDYVGDRYNFFRVFSSGLRGKRAITRQYPVGLETICYVNPNAPLQSVLDRTFDPSYLLGLLGLLFAAAGVALLAYQGSSTTKAASFAQGTRGQRGPLFFGSGGPDPNAPLTLKPQMGPWTKFFGALVLGGIWNGFSWTMFYFAWSDGAVVGIAILSIFVLLGFGIVCAVVYFFLAAFNPRPEITIRPGAPCLGETFDMVWEFSGSVARMDAFRIEFEAYEEAKYQRGTDTVTEKNTFEKLVVAEAQDPRAMQSGQIRIAIPEYSMHSFSAEHNKVEWWIRVVGEIPMWPDVNEVFVIQVRPMEKR